MNKKDFKVGDKVRLIGSILIYEIIGSSTFNRALGFYEYLDIKGLNGSYDGKTYYDVSVYRLELVNSIENKIAKNISRHPLTKIFL